MALFLRDGVWQDTSTDTVDHGGSGFVDEAGQVFNAQGEYQPGTGNPDLMFIGGAAVNDPNRSFAPDILVNGHPASDSFYEAKGQFAPSAAQMAQTYDPALGGDFWSQNATPADTGQGLSGLAGFIRGHGYLVPLALASGGLAIEAAGGLGATSAGIGAGTEGAAYTGAGAQGAAGIGAMGPTYAEMGYTPGAFTDANLGYTGAAQELGLSGSSTGLTDLSGAQGSAMLESMGLNTSGMSAADILKYATQAKQALGVGTTLAKLLGGTGTTSGTTSGGINSNALANLLRPAAQTNDYVGQIKANQNPFTFTSAGQTVASPGMYDVSGSNLATALRKA